MNYGLYLATSGVQTSMARLDVASNNLANSSTPAFRPDQIFIQQRDAARREDHLPFMGSSRLLEKLGAGVIPTRTAVVNADGPVKITNRPLDVALQGDGFLIVQAGEGEDAIRLTRDGRMTVNQNGVLVRATDGSPVLDQNDVQIRLDPKARIAIRRDGTIVADGARVARLGVATVPDPTSLIKIGSGLLRPEGGRQSLLSGTARIEQGAIEDSGVNPIRALMEATAAAKAAEGNLSMVRAFDETMGRAINTLGRVA